MPFAVTVVAVVMVMVTVTTLTCIWLGTSYSLKKHGYRPNQTKEAYEGLQTTLKRVSTDIDDIRAQIAELIILNHDKALLEHNSKPAGGKR